MSSSTTDVVHINPKRAPQKCPVTRTKLETTSATFLASVSVAFWSYTSCDLSLKTNKSQRERDESCRRGFYRVFDTERGGRSDRVDGPLMSALRIKS